MNKIKVLHILEQMRTGGAEKVVSSIVRGLSGDEFSIEVWCLSGLGEEAEKLISDGFKVKNQKINSYYDPFNFFKLAKLIKAVSPGVVHTHTYFSGVLARIAARIAGVPVVFHHVHSSYWGYSARNRIIEKVLSRITDKVICVSEDVKKFVVCRERVAEDKTVIIYNGIDLGTCCKRQNDPRKDTIISVGSLNRNKGHSVLIEAVALLKRRNISARCIIAGEGPLEAELKELVSSKNVADLIEFRGMVKDIYSVLTEGDIFVLPSVEREGLSLALLEAMFSGKAVIASFLGGVPEVVNSGQNGLLVEPGNVEELAGAIEDLLQDKDKREHLSVNATSTVVQRFSTERMVKDIERLYRKRLNSKGLK